MSVKNKAAVSRKGMFNSKNAKIVFTVLALVAPLSVAHAVTGSVNFGATVVRDDDNNNGGGGGPGDGGGGGPIGGNGCQIVLVQNGSVAASGDFTQLGSKQPGATPGVVEITKSGTNALSISVDAPNSFTLAPTDGDNGVVFSATYQASGDTATIELPGTIATPVNTGTTLLAVNLNATRSDPFPAGTYEATTTVRCE